MQAVKEQYPSEDYKTRKAIPVRSGDNTKIDIVYPHESISGWQVIQTYPGHPVYIHIKLNHDKYSFYHLLLCIHLQIELEELNWEKGLPTQQALISAHKKKEYPPRFILEFCGRDAQRSVAISISLTNVNPPVSLDINLYMPCESLKIRNYRA